MQGLLGTVVFPSCHSHFSAAALCRKVCTWEHSGGYSRWYWRVQLFVMCSPLVVARCAGVDEVPPAALRCAGTLLETVRVMLTVLC